MWLNRDPLVDSRWYWYHFGHRSLGIGHSYMKRRPYCFSLLIGVQTRSLTWESVSCCLKSLGSNKRKQPQSIDICHRHCAHHCPLILAASPWPLNVERFVFSRVTRQTYSRSLADMINLRTGLQATDGITIFRFSCIVIMCKWSHEATKFIYHSH